MLLSIVSGVGAILVTFHLFPVLNSFARDYIESELIADGATIVTVFVVALVLFSFVGQFVSRRVKESGMGFLDRTLGFAFGLVGGAVAVCLAYLFMVWLTPPDDHPEWLKEARVLPLVIYGGQLLRNLAPEETLVELEAAAEEGKAKVLEPLTAEEALRRLIRPKPVETPADSDQETGYKREERKQLERLFEAQEAK